MKQTKRLIALAVALVLALTLALPAMAAVNWEDFYIITEPQGQTISRSESCTLSVEVNIPEGVDEVTYQWYARGEILAGATANTLQVSPDDAYPKNAYSYTSFSCSITAIDNDDGQSRTLSTSQVTVRPKRTFGDKLYSVTLGPFAEAFARLPFIFEQSRNGSWLGFPVYLLSLPIIILVNFIVNIIELFRH